MSPWEILGIEATTDKKTIKKTYAALLKKHKPDEDPEKFQQIYQAYKLALSPELEYSMPIAQGSFSQKLNLTDHKAETVLQENSAKDVEETVLSNEYNHNLKQQKLVEDLLEKIHQMAFEKVMTRSEVKNWKFVEDFNKIEELGLRTQVAKQAFKKIAEYNLFYLKENKRLLISPEILKYLNSAFNWEENWQEYQSIFPPNYLDLMFVYFEKEQNDIFGRIGLSKRISAIFTDLVPAGILFLPFYWWTDITEKNGWLLFFIFFSAHRLFFELWKTKASLGKLADEALVVDEYGNNCSSKAVLIRHLIINLSITPFYLLMFTHNIDWYYLSSVSGMILSAHIICLVFGKGLLHDYLTKTLVIRKVRNNWFSK
ncbi:MAG: RDD family protein [Proteobacteria bacterium]|nr:RDD family protein [Pseudomonadota bacterium]